MSYFQLNSNSTVLSASGPGGASYTVRTVEGAGMARARTTLSGLQKHAAYAVVVQAYNSRGAGPASPPTTATTMEDGETIHHKDGIHYKLSSLFLHLDCSSSYIPNIKNIV